MPYVMKQSTQDLFATLRVAIELWSIEAKHRDAYVRGSQARKDIAEQIVRNREWLGRREFLAGLRYGIANATRRT